MNSKHFFRLFFWLLPLLLFTMATCNPDENEVDPRDKFLGQWHCTETSTQNPTPITFTVDFTKDLLTTDEMYIANFYHLGFDEKAKVLVNFNNFEIPSQVVCNITFSGNGSFSQNKITMTYYANDGADIDTVNASFSRN